MKDIAYKENWEIKLNQDELDQFVLDVVRATNDPIECVERIIKRLEEKEMFLICAQLLIILNDFKGGKYTAIEDEDIRYEIVIR